MCPGDLGQAGGVGSVCMKLAVISCLSPGGKSRSRHTPMKV